MPVLIGTPSLVLASRVEVYHTCSVDLTWQRAIHSCQRCPRAVLVTSNAAIAPITQSNVERATSRFCPAGVHMSNCVPASEIFAAPQKPTVSRPQLTANSVVLGSTGLNLSPSAWGPPNLPVPAVTHHHPVHTIHTNRTSSNVSTTGLSTNSARESEKPTPQQIPAAERAKLIVAKSKDTESNKVSSAAQDATTAPATTTTTSSTTPARPVSPSKEHEVVVKRTGLKSESKTSRIPASEISIIRENETPKSPEVAQVNGDEEDRVITIPDSNRSKPADREFSLTNHDSETVNESRPADSNAVKKQRKEDSVQSADRLKSGVHLDDLQTADAEISIPNRVRSVGLEEGNDKDRSSRASSRSTERSVVGSRHAGSSLVPDSVKPDTGLSRQQSTGVTRDTRETVRGQASSVSSSGGGIGDVGTIPMKTNGAARLNHSRPTSVEPTSPESKPPAVTTPVTQLRKLVPSFHFPLGTTRMTKEEITFEIDRAKRELTHLVETLANGNKNSTSDPLIPYSSFGQVAKALNCPLYWKYVVYSASGGTNDHQPLTLSAVLKMWNQVLTSCPDETARFVHMLTKGRATQLVHTDFNPLIQDILESHPGLAFLQAAKDFHSRYVATVVARIFFNVNTSWSGRITLGELRRSNFLSVLGSLEEEEDINVITQYFSYEHFYVIYCKFWELDEDHDLIISRADLARHNNYAISERMIDRIFSGTVTRGTAFKEGVMTYPDFVWFLLAEEDKRHPRSIEYWFRCMDLDGDGLLSMYELEYFYSEQVARMEEMGIEPISFEDCLCQCLDMVKPALGDKIRLSDMKQCRLCHIFFDTFFNLPKYLQHEQRDPFANLRDIEEGLNELSDWDRYAAEAYEMLVAVEGGNQEDGVDDDDGEDEELEEEHDVESPSVGLGSKTDTVSRKENGSKLDVIGIEQKNPGSAATVGAGE